MAEFVQETHDDPALTSTPSLHEGSRDQTVTVPRQKPANTLGQSVRSKARAGSSSKRLCLNGQERLFVHKMLQDTEFWGKPRQQQLKLFEGISQKIKTDVEVPFRDVTRRNFNVDYIKSLIKNMPRFVAEKRQKYKRKFEEASVEGVELSHEELQELLSKVEQLELQTLKISEGIVENMSNTLSSSDDTVEAVQASAVKSRKRRLENRINSQKQYAERKRQARKLEAANQNRLRLAEHRSEKLLTASVNDGRNTGQLLGALVQIVGLQAGISADVISNMLGTAAAPPTPLPEPPEPDLIVISSEEDSCPEGPNGESGDELEDDNCPDEPEITNET